MTHLDQKVVDLQEKIDRQIWLEDQISLWQSQIRTLSPEIHELRRIMDQEQMDVDRLENGGLGNMVHKLLGTMDDKIDKERQEANEAMTNFTCASDNLERLEVFLKDAEAELESLRDCPSEYQQAMEEKIRLLEEKAAQTPDQAEVYARLIQYERKCKSLQEALVYAKLAAHGAAKNKAALETANNLSEDAARQEALDTAHIQAEIVMEQMTRLQAKLAQMGIDPQDHILVGSYFRTPKIFILAGTDDEAQANRITEALDQVDVILKDTQAIREKLEFALSQVENSIKLLQEAIS